MSTQKKISELTAVASSVNTDELVVVQSGVTLKATRAQILDVGATTQAYSAVLDTVADGNAGVTFANTGLKIKDTDASHTVTLAIGSDISADRTVTITPGDSDRTITLTDDVTMGDYFNQSVKTTASVTFDNLTLSATNALLAGSDRAITLLNDVTSNTITIGGTGSTTSIYNLAVTGSTFIATVTTVEIEDKKIALGKGGSTAALTAAGISLLGDADAEVGYIQTGAADNTIFELNAPGNAFVLTLDVNATKTVTVTGALNIEADSAINQDLTTDASVVFTQTTSATFASTGAMAITPTNNLTMTQNSVAVISSVAASAVVNTLYLKEGTVGVGVVPTSFFHVEKSVAPSSSFVKFKNTSATGEGVSIETTGSNNSRFALRVLSNSGAITGLYVSNAGNVSVGKTTPAFQFELSTDSAGKPSTNTWTIVSDPNIKNILGRFTDGLSVIEKIDPIRFKYNGLAGFRDTKSIQIGINAKKLQPVAPYCISTNKHRLRPNDAEVELLHYEGHAMTFVLINAVKELSAKSKFQQKKIEELEAKICST